MNKRKWYPFVIITYFTAAFNDSIYEYSLPDYETGNVFRDNIQKASLDGHRA